MANWPLFFRVFILDFAETALGLIFALNLVLPGDVDSAKIQAIVLTSAIAAAIVSAARRAIPGFVAWLKGVLVLPVK